MSLTNRLDELWGEARRTGFLLSADAPIETRVVTDPATGVPFRLRWLPHRELRTDVDELERRGILAADRDEARLFRDPRDPTGRHCFLCPGNIRVCHPLERLLPITLAGRDYLAGANFSWIETHHFTVLAAQHVDQDLTPDIITAMLELHAATGGRYRVLYNAPDAGATIPWHLHLQITTAELPVEHLPDAAIEAYPTTLRRHRGPGLAWEVSAGVSDWVDRDPERHRVNVLVAGSADDPTVDVFLRDRRLTHASRKGLMGGFEMAGVFAFSEAARRTDFLTADADLVRRVLAEIDPA